MTREFSAIQDLWLENADVCASVLGLPWVLTGMRCSKSGEIQHTNLEHRSAACPGSRKIDAGLLEPGEEMYRLGLVPRD